jgi:diaminohydroxyphosphoribosylaminopyrimidine deaminase / 5-amino-6-(5-phosphoribosylamino)uracil reductase
VPGPIRPEEKAMRRAAELAKSRRPHPNPRVGAVILDSEGNPLAEGAHSGPGRPHAERVALDRLAGPVPNGATMVVTLEPCDHHGLTPPCTEAIISAGISRVVVGALDPDPRVAGAGVERLRRAGIEVEVGVLAGEAEAVDPAYFHHRRTGRARFTLKAALTLDGQTAAVDGTSRWITGPEARRDAHLLRARGDAVMIGAGTLRSDDPDLTVRLADHDGPQPRAIVIAGDEPMPLRARLWQRTDTVVVATSDPGVGGEAVVVEPDASGRPDLTRAAVALADLGLLEILVEGGATLAASLWNHSLVDRGVTYVGGRVAGGVGLPPLAGTWNTFDDSRRVHIIGSRSIGEDVRIDWEPVRESASG